MTEITGWSSDATLNILQRELQEYVALQTQFSKTVQTIEKRYKSEKARKSKLMEAINILISKHNDVGDTLNEVKKSAE